MVSEVDGLLLIGFAGGWFVGYIMGLIIGASG